MNDHFRGVRNMINDTPRTDEAQFGTGRVSVNFACQLERELNAANEMFRKLNIHTLNLTDRIKRLEDSIEKLKDAGDLVFIWLLYNRSHLGGLDVDSALREWKQSKKEAKP